MPDDESTPKEGIELNVPMNAAELPTFGTGGEGPTIFADMIRGAYSTNFVTKFNLFETKMDTIDERLAAKHTATIVVPTDQLRAWVTFLDRIATDAGYPSAMEEDDGE